MQMMDLSLGVEYLIVGLAIQIAMGMLQPLVNVFFNLALGIFVSALMRSSGVAIAVSYGAVLIVRAGAWLATSVLGSVLIFALMDVGALELASGEPSPGMISAILGGLLSNLIPLALLLAECLGVVGLVWGAIWLLDRE
jgi:hypothetical protein